MTAKMLEATKNRGSFHHVVVLPVGHQIPKRSKSVDFVLRRRNGAAFPCEVVPVLALMDTIASVPLVEVIRRRLSARIIVYEDRKLYAVRQVEDLYQPGRVAPFRHNSPANLRVDRVKLLIQTYLVSHFYRRRLGSRPNIPHAIPRRGLLIGQIFSVVLILPCHYLGTVVRTYDTTNEGSSIVVKATTNRIPCMIL